MTSKMNPSHNPSVVHLLRAGEWFVYDTHSYEDGDIFYVEVMAVLPQLPADVDRVGDGNGGYRVRVRCSESVERGTPDGVTDHYTFRYVTAECTRITASQAEHARAAGWPSERAFLKELLSVV